MMRQVQVVPSGVQQWNRNVISISRPTPEFQYYAYASSLAIYVYRRLHSGSCSLYKILAGQKATVRG